MTPTLTNRRNVSASHAALRWSANPRLTSVCLLVSDLLSICLTIAAAVFAEYLISGVWDIDGQGDRWPYFLAYLAVYAAVGMYSGAGLDDSEELRRSGLAAFPFLGALAIATRLFSLQVTSLSPDLLPEMGLFFLCLSLSRKLLREIAGGRDWWGFPTVVFGSKPPILGKGLKPVAVITGYPRNSIAEVTASVLNSKRSTYALVTEASEDIHKSFAEFLQNGVRFSQIVYLPERTEFPGIWIRPRNTGGRLIDPVFRSGLPPHEQAAKRVLDLVVTSVVALAGLPAVLLIVAAIRLDSNGPALFAQPRIGRGGKLFLAWKFRTMAVNSEAVLQAELERNPLARLEWEQFHKLKQDPRITRVGRILRRASLDELPQLWNVLRGDMSLVGPRPIVPAEAGKYGEAIGLYTRVRSGLTGLWQVSGRSDTSYQERVRLDGVYVRNWSVWLDVQILVRTISAVLSRRGAY